MIMEKMETIEIKNYCVECGRELEIWEKTICDNCEENLRSGCN